ncbi:Cyclin-A3-2 [Platanthera guangdongensis]|uniref:Cyclin-A3-2 n=1 Tax=Platanthera guangdongensis TaxID=2320717 RepID=A0ABR2M430_9ASPA
MESIILKFLKFEMDNPTIKTFLSRASHERFVHIQYPNLLLELMGCYLAELSLLVYRCVQFIPAVVAASAVFVAKFTINKENPPCVRPFG